ncbi:MAG TPA: hypothetical protein VMN56_01435 [Casimicrobiaceae bacterium]|nr:hypothetical protein [Casimicrobiaceae bacterium]
METTTAEGQDGTDDTSATGVASTDFHHTAALAIFLGCMFAIVFLLIVPTRD